MIAKKLLSQGRGLDAFAPTTIWFGRLTMYKMCTVSSLDILMHVATHDVSVLSYSNRETGRSVLHNSFILSISLLLFTGIEWICIILHSANLILYYVIFLGNKRVVLICFYGKWWHYFVFLDLNTVVVPYKPRWLQFCRPKNSIVEPCI